MEGADLQIIRVEEKVQQLLKQYQFVQKEVKRLQKENVRLGDDLQLRTKQAEELHQKMDSLKINTLSMDINAKKDLEKRINTYLKEIDNCLALLNS